MYHCITLRQGKRKKISNACISDVSNKACKIIPKLICCKLNCRNFWELGAFAVLKKVRESLLHAFDTREVWFTKSASTASRHWEIRFLSMIQQISTLMYILYFPFNLHILDFVSKIALYIILICFLQNVKHNEKKPKLNYSILFNTPHN